MLAQWSEVCPALCDSKHGSPPGSSVYGDSLGKNTGVGSHALLQGIFPTQGSNLGFLHWGWMLYQLSHQGNPRTLEWVAHPFFSRSSRTQESNQGLLHCKQILYQLSYQRSPSVLKKKSHLEKKMATQSIILA